MESPLHAGILQLAVHGFAADVKIVQDTMQTGASHVVSEAIAESDGMHAMHEIEERASHTFLHPFW